MMSITISGYVFEGPYWFTFSLKNKSGAYVILGSDNVKDIVDVGESSDVRDRVDNHDRKDCWNRQGYANLKYAARYTDASSRKTVADKVRREHNPPCGDR